MRQVGQSYQAEEEAQRVRVFEEGKDIKPGIIPTKVLYGESDGVWISLQGEAKQKTEVRVGILHTGKRVVGVG